MIRILSLCGSPVPGSSTRILLRRLGDAIRENLSLKSQHELIRLSDYDITPCQACGEAPTPRYCFIDDGMTALYRRLERCDCLLLGTPIYFDSVSAQAKAFIDRCNCMRPYDFNKSQSERHFVRLLSRPRPGAIALVGGKQAWFEGARRCVAGFFKWIEVTNEACLKFSSVDPLKVGEVASQPDVLREVDKIGRRLARIIRKQHGRR